MALPTDTGIDPWQPSYTGPPTESLPPGRLRWYGQYQPTYDPATYGDLFTDLRAGWNQDMLNMLGFGPGGGGGLGLFTGAYGKGLAGMQGLLSRALTGMPTGIDRTALDALIGQYTGGMNQYLRQLQDYASPTMGTDILNEFFGLAPQLQGLVRGETSDLERSMLETGSRFARRATEGVASQFAGLGGLYGSGAQRAAGEAVGDIFAPRYEALEQARIGLTGNLWGQGLEALKYGRGLGLQGLTSAAGLYGGMMGNLLGTESGIAQQNLAAQLAGVNALLQGAGLWGGFAGQGLAGAGNIYGLAAGLQPEFVAPDLYFQPGISDRLWGLLNATVPAAVQAGIGLAAV